MVTQIDERAAGTPGAVLELRPQTALESSLPCVRASAQGLDEESLLTRAYMARRRIVGLHRPGLDDEALGEARAERNLLFPVRRQVGATCAVATTCPRGSVHGNTGTGG
jgi:hypothetical protein